MKSSTAVLYVTRLHIRSMTLCCMYRGSTGTWCLASMRAYMTMRTCAAYMHQQQYWLHFVGWSVDMRHD